MANEQCTRMRVDGYTRVCLTAISVLLTVLVIGLWADLAGPAGRAQAAKKYADEDARRAMTEGRWGTSSAPQQAIVTAQRKTNAKLDELMKLLRSGQVRVQMVAGPEAAGGGDGRKPKKR